MKACDGRLSVNPCLYDDNVDANDDEYAYKDRHHVKVVSILTRMLVHSTRVVWDRSAPFV